MSLSESVSRPMFHHRTRNFRSTIVIAAVAMLLLAGCGGSDPEPTATPTKTPALVEAPPTPVPATNTPVPAVVEPAVSTDEGAGGDSGPSSAAEVAVITASILNVRAEPNAGATIVREAAEGAQFDVLGKSDDGQWTQLGENGAALGWAATEFLQIQGGTASSGDSAQAVAPTAAPAPTTAASGPPPGGYLPATMGSPDFGGQAFLWWKPEVAQRDLELMKEGGFGWVKQSFAWETIEGAGKGQFDWSIADRVVRDVNNNGLKLLARVSTDPEKRNFWPGPPPANAANFADFIFALANRYNCTPQAVGCIQAFQVWNEPNLAREWGDRRPNPAQYADFLRQAYASVKRGNPNALVVSAGMAPTGDNSDVAMPDDVFYEQMYAAMGSSNGYFDMLGVHGAGFAAPPELDPAEAAASSQYGGHRFFAFRHVEDVRAIMERYGDGGKKIVLLEFGWTYDSVNPSYKWHGADAGIDQFVQADYLKRAYQYADANWPWIGLMSLLTMPNVDWLNDGNPQDEEQYWWAIMDPSTEGPAYRAAIIVLCDYFNEVANNRYCPYDPDPARRGSR